MLRFNKVKLEYINKWAHFVVVHIYLATKVRPVAAVQTLALLGL